MAEENKAQIPFTLKLTEAGQVLRIPIGGVRALIRSKQLESLSDPAGPRIQTQSIIEFLGRTEFKKRWPRGLGEVKFEESRELLKRKVKGKALRG